MRSRSVEISRVTAEARPAVSAACHAEQDANLVLLFMEFKDVKVGANLILVPSGNLVELDEYHFESLS